MPPILLRQPNAADLEVVVQVHCDPRTNQFNPAGPATPEQAAHMLDAWIAHWKELGFGYWAIADAAQPKAVIGFGGVMRKNVAHLHGLNIYFRLAPAAWGNGYASQVGRAALELAFGELQADEVLGLVRPGNLPSRRTLERIGFVQYTTAEDVPGAEPSLIYRATPSVA